MKTAIVKKVEETLNKLPEVVWDRWHGDLVDALGIGVFGWIARDDGKSDFVYLRIDGDGAWMVATSSAKYSADFCGRLMASYKRSSTEGHKPCKRVAGSFDVANAVQIA